MPTGNEEIWWKKLLEICHVTVFKNNFKSRLKFYIIFFLKLFFIFSIYKKKRVGIEKESKDFKFRVIFSFTFSFNLLKIFNWTVRYGKKLCNIKK